MPPVLLSVSTSISLVFRCSTELQVAYLCQNPEDFGFHCLTEPRDFRSSYFSLSCYL